MEQQVLIQLLDRHQAIGEVHIHQLQEDHHQKPLEIISHGKIHKQTNMEGEVVKQLMRVIVRERVNKSRCKREKQ
jgi:hypothetical protein